MEWPSDARQRSKERERLLSKQLERASSDVDDLKSAYGVKRSGECQVRSEFASHPCGGKRTIYKMEVYWQPPGKGCFRIPTTVLVCEEHKKLIGSGSYCHATFKDISLAPKEK